MAIINSGGHVIIILFIIPFTCSEYTFNPDWEKPDVFSKQEILSSGKPTHLTAISPPKCQECINGNDANLSSLYKKLAKFLMNRKSMKFDESSRTFYRSLHLHITEEQMNRFDAMTDANDMDQLVAEVLYQSNSGTFELFKEMYLTWRDLFVLYWEWIVSSRQVVLGLQFAGFVLTWFASRRFKFSFTIVGLFFVLFYLYSFLDSECHRKKEIEKAAQMFGMLQNNPCNTTSFWSYYFRNQHEDCKKYLDNSYDVSCTLIDVYEEFVNVFVYQQMWNFINNSVANILKVYATYGIIGALVVTSICIYLFNNYIQLIIKSVFHHLFTSRTYSSRSANNIGPQRINGAGDTISTEVLNKILEITRDQTKLNALHLTRMTSNSGVQSIDVVDGNESTESGENSNASEVQTVQTVEMVTGTVVSDEHTDLKSTSVVKSTIDVKSTSDAKSNTNES